MALLAGRDYPRSYREFAQWFPSDAACATALEALKKFIVVIGLEIKQPRGYGRVRMRLVPDASGDSLQAFVCETLAPGSIVHTDGWSSYNSLSALGYTHQRTIMSSSSDPAHVTMPRC
jgi:hypothetical protein